MDKALKKAVEEVCGAAESLKLDIVLVGALMAEFTPEMGSDYPRFRRTNDADFGVYVRDWPTYQKFHEELMKRDFKPNPRIEHRLHLGTAMVDLIPYGREIAPDGKITWPKSELEMSVLGFDEVCAAARKAASEKELPVPVITVSGFVLLKVIAYLERKARNDAKRRDDARDIEYWLHNYAGGIKDDRRFDLAGKPGLVHEDYETAGAALLGREVRALASSDAAAYVERLLKESEDPDSPFMDALAAGFLEESADKKRAEGRALLAAFKKGFQSERP
ncbi:MAG: hypothetical protein HYT79_05490 [Elusimicrobia bacterium]|nr:hypothetical protein [Elusimicrobiota bacterium]